MDFLYLNMDFLLDMILMCKSPEAMQLLLAGLGQNQTEPRNLPAINSTVYHMVMIEPEPDWAFTRTAAAEGTQIQTFPLW